MLVTFRLVVIALAGVGLAVGVSFGLGVAYGKGDPKEVQSGLTQQQIQALVGGTGSGATGAGASGAAGARGTAVASGTTVAGGQTPGGAAAFGNNTTGQVTAVEGNTITVQTAAGAVKVNISANTAVTTLAAGKASDFKVGDTIIAAGTRGADGSVAATSVSALPPLLQNLFSGGTGGTPGQQQRPGATPAASP